MRVRDEYDVYEVSFLNECRSIFMFRGAEMMEKLLWQ